MPSCLSPQEEENTIDSNIKRIRNIILEEDKDKYNFIK
jgi:hypothetical protein